MKKYFKKAEKILKDRGKGFRLATYEGFSTHFNSKKVKDINKGVLTIYEQTIRQTKENKK